jgi:hypothetical protein
MSHSLAGEVRFTRTGRPMRVIRSGQGMKYHAKWCFYQTGRAGIHEECAPGMRVHCQWCRSKVHNHRGPTAGAGCWLCVEHSALKGFWYQSKAEARTAQRLDDECRHGKILSWRRARAVVLQAKIPGQQAILYTPDFVVTLPDGTREALEVKSIATLTPVSRVKIKLYRACARRYGWPPLRIITGSGRALKV